MELSVRSENALKMLMVSAVAVGGVGGSTSRDRLQSCDVAAALGMIDDVRHRIALQVRAGQGDEREVVELLQLIRQNLSGFGWFVKSDMRSSAYRVKLDRVSRCAIARLVGKTMTKSEVADCVGIDRSNYFRTWEPREKNIYQLILQWSIDGDFALKQALSDDFVKV